MHNTVALDFMLRVSVLEKHEVSQWKTQKSADIQLEVAAAEQAAFTQEREIRVTNEQPGYDADTEEPSKATPKDPSEDKPNQAEVKESDQQPDYDSLKAIGYLMFNLKPLTGLLISFLNGFIVAGKPDCSVLSFSNSVSE